MIQLNRQPNDRLIELGGGASPIVTPRCLGGNDVAVDVRACHTPDGKQTVDFTADFNEPLPISDNEFDGVICIYAIEHLSFHKTNQFLSECLRICKPGGKLVLVTANTEAQFKWIANNPEGWDYQGLFDSASNIIYGSQDYLENTHKSYFSPSIISDLLSKAGWENVLVQPYGARDTDLAATATKSVRITKEKIEEWKARYREITGHDLDADQAVTLSGQSAPMLGGDTMPQGWSNNAPVPSCGVEGPNGLVCGREKGHTGNHAG